MSFDTSPVNEEDAVEMAYQKRYFDKGLHEGTLSLKEIGKEVKIELPANTRLNIEAVFIMPSGAKIGTRTCIKSLEEWQAAYRNDTDEKDKKLRIEGKVVASYLVGSVSETKTARFNTSELVWGKPTNSDWDSVKSNFFVS